LNVLAQQIAVMLTGLALACGLPVANAEPASGPVKERHIRASRAGATQTPRSEEDQVVVDGWPLYRTERGQEAFNAAMATLAATDGPVPIPAAFKGCAALDCHLSLPAVSDTGWLSVGRLWVSPTEYVIFASSPRLRPGASYRRRPFRSMRYFVLHEFHNSSRNTDLYDTISSHKSSVFVPLYLSKPMTDAAGRRFVVVLQVAPYDVISIHATNYGSAGPGMEVARNYNDAVEPLQNAAGILVATMLKTAAPHLQVVNHRGVEGAPMLGAYERRLASLRSRGSAPTVGLPFVAAAENRVASTAMSFDDLILRRGSSPHIPVAARAIVPQRAASVASLAGSEVPAQASVVLDSAAAPTLVRPIRLATRTVRKEAVVESEPQLIEPVRPALRPRETMAR
jgi:hypothetical protein